MSESISDKQVPLPGDYPLPQMLLRPFQQELARQGIHFDGETAYKLLQMKGIQDVELELQRDLTEQGIDVSPEEAYKLLEQKIVHDAERYLQQNLAEHGIEVSPDEAVAIWGLHNVYRMMERTGTTGPHEAIERMASDDPSKPYEPID